MKRYLDLVGRWLTAAAGLSALGYLTATEANGGRHAIWPYFLFAAMIIGGVGLYFAGQKRIWHVRAVGRSSKKAALGSHNLVHQLAVVRYPELTDSLIDFSDVIESGTKWLSGRDDLLDRLIGIADKEPRAYVVIEAAAGLGKTALAAGMAERAHAASFFASRSRGIDLAEQCLNHLSSELIVRFGLDYDHLPLNAGKDSSFFLKVLGEATSKAKGPVWIVVDAINEAAPTRPGANPFFLPDRLPTHSYVVVTTQPDTANIVTAPNTPRHVERLLEESDEQLLAIEQFLRCQAMENPVLVEALGRSDPPMLAEDLVKRIKASSQGNFMYVTFLLEDWRRQEKPDVIKLTKFLPNGLAEYYAQTWDRIREENGWNDWSRLYSPVIECLGVAREPVSIEWLSVHTGQDPTEIRDRAITRWTGFLRRDATTDQDRWHISHSSLTEFLRQHGDLASCEAGIASYYLEDPDRWSLHDGYPIRHLAEHLVDTKQAEQLFALVDRRDWYEAHSLLDPTGMSYTRDVSSAWSVAELSNRADAALGKRPQLMTRELRSALATSSVYTLARTVPPRLLGQLVAAEIWPPAESLAMAEQMPDVRDRSQALAELSCVLPRSLIDDVFKTTSTMTDDYARATVLCALADRLDADLRVAALAQARTLVPDVAVRTLAALSQTLGPNDRTVELHHASEIANNIAAPPDKAQALVSLIPRMSGQDRANAVTRALEAFDRWFDLEWTGRQKGTELSLIAAATELGPYLTRDTKHDLGRRCEMLARGLDAATGMVEVQGEDGDPHRIISLTINLRVTPRGTTKYDPPARSVALAMASSLFQASDGRKLFAEAEELATSIQDEFDRGEALVRMLSFAPDDRRAEIVSHIYELVVQSGSGRLLAMVLPNLPDPEQGAAALSVLEAAIEAGVPDMAVMCLDYIDEDSRRDAITETLGIARRIGDEWQQLEILCHMLSDLPESSAYRIVARVKELVESTEPDGGACVVAEPAVAFCLARGDTDEALELADLANLTSYYWARENGGWGRSSGELVRSAELVVDLLDHLDDTTKMSRLAEMVDGLRGESGKKAWFVLAEAIPAGYLNRFEHYVRQFPDTADDCVWAMAALAGRYGGDACQQIVTELIGTMVGGASAAVSAIAAIPELQEESVAKLVVAVDDIEDASSHAKAVAALAPRVNASILERLTTSSIEKARVHAWPLTRLSIVRSLAPYMSGNCRAAAFDIARSFREPEYKASALAALISNDAVGDTEDSLVTEALAAMEEAEDARTNWTYLGDAVADMAPYVPESLLSRLIDVVGNLPQDPIALRQTCERLTKVASKERSKLASGLLRAIARTGRSQLLKALPDLKPLFRQVMGDYWASLVAEEIEQAANVWP